MSITLKEIHVYPVKGCKGISLNESDVEPSGLMWDRRWMVVDEDGQFITQRDLPALALISARPLKGELHLSTPEGEKVSIPMFSSVAPKVVNIWRDEVEAVDEGDEVADFLSSYFERRVRLVFFPGHSVRPVDIKYGKAGDRVHFPDGYPVLILSCESLEDLNGRLASPLPINRFRPNMVVEGCKPFEEDTWKEIEMDGVRFECVKPCERCVVITINQNTLERGLEPLATLAKYRKKGGKVLFGQNSIPRSFGRIRVGAQVKVLSTSS